MGVSGEAAQGTKAVSRRGSEASAEGAFTVSRRRMLSAGPLIRPPTSVAKHPSLIRVRITLGNRL